VLLIRRRRPIGEPADIDRVLAAGGDRVVAPLGSSRIGDALRGFGGELGAASGEAVTHWLPDLDAGAASLATHDLGARFAVVVLASHLVNTPDAALRAALVRAAARHLASGGRVLIEHHPLDWLDTAAESWTERDGRRLGMVDVRIDRPFVAAVSVFEAGGAVVRQPFRALVLDDAELDAGLAAAGLHRTRRLGPTWLEAEAAAKSLE